MRTEKKFQLVHNWIFIPVWNECRNVYFKKPVEINKGKGHCQATLHCDWWKAQKANDPVLPKNLQGTLWIFGQLILAILLHNVVFHPWILMIHYWLAPDISNSQQKPWWLSGQIELGGSHPNVHYCPRFPKKEEDKLSNNNQDNDYYLKILCFLKAINVIHIYKDFRKPINQTYLKKISLLKIG